MYVMPLAMFSMNTTTKTIFLRTYCDGRKLSLQRWTPFEMSRTLQQHFLSAGPIMVTAPCQLDHSRQNAPVLTFVEDMSDQ